MLTEPEFVTGRTLWKLGFPSSINPGDPRFDAGQISAITHTGAGTGVVSIFSGGPTDTFSITLEILDSGSFGVGTFQYRLQDADPWSVRTLIPADSDGLGYSVFALPESGLELRFDGDFLAMDTYVLTTVESPQIADMRRAISGEMARKLRVRGQTPPADFGIDISLLAARLVAGELLELGGYDPKAQHNQLVMNRYKRARGRLNAIAEELEQSDLPGQEAVLGVACHSQEPQGRHLW